MNFSHFILRPKLIAAAVAILYCVPSLLGQNSSFVSFNAPGACAGTFPQAVNLSGTIAGYAENCGKVASGFLRQPDGTFTEFYPTSLYDLLVLGINNSGQMLAYGLENLSPYEFVGLLRDVDGQWAEFTPSAAVATFPLGLDNGGAVVGEYQDSAQGDHGFLRNADGSFTLVDDPDALLAPWEGTVAVAINDNGTLVGNYTDKNTGTERGFIRDQFGNFTNFDAATVSSANTYPIAISLAGEVAGYYCINHCPVDGNSILTGFLRSAAGSVTDIAFPGAVSTQVTGMNDSGVIVGAWRDSTGYEHGFQRDASGKITEIAPSGPFLSLVPTSINNHGEITGNYTNEGFVTVGFLQLDDEK